MFSKIAAPLILFLIFSQSIMATNFSREDRQFEVLANKYIAELMQNNPEWATTLGEHKFDDRLDDYSLAAVRRDRNFALNYLKQLKEISPAKLSKVNNIDYRIMAHSLEYSLFRLDVLREYEWNPMTYNVGGALNSLISRDFGPLKDRLMSAKARLLLVPQVVENAKLNLKNPPKVFTETAIAQNKGTINLIKGDLQMYIDEAGLKDELAPAQKTAIDALEDFGAWMEKDLLPRSNGEFRIGDFKYREKLKFALQSDLTKEQILEHAMKDLRATQEKMFRIALPIYKSYNPNIDYDLVKLDAKTVVRIVLGRLAEDRPNNETIVAQANQDLKESTEFVRLKKLVTVPTEPVKVIEMPEFARGTAVAYFDSAGPFEKKNETFFAISPTPKDWSDERKESFYKEYNDYMLENLTVHEAMPGHYLQIMHSNKFKAPTMIRALFRSGTFTEGWAVYAEQLMAENHYGGEKVEMQQLKMKLRVIINAIIDQKIHTAGMTEKEAVDFMMNEGFQEEGEAVGKWKRAMLSSTQLSTYYVGSVEVNEIRKAYEAKHKGKIDMLKMHDEMLSFGSPAAKYVREMMGLN